MTTDKTVAVEILRQLGGNRFIMMTGAKNLACDNNSMTAKIGRNAKGVTHFKVELTSMDDYIMTFYRCRLADIKELAKVEGLYFDQLQTTFTEQTGLYTYL